MSCQEIQDNLSAYLDGELPSEAVEAVERHLEECAVCRDLLAELRSLTDMLHRLPPAQAPQGLSDEIQSHLERRMLLAGSPEEVEGGVHPDRRLARERPPMWPRVAAIAACFFLAAGIAWLLAMPGMSERQVAVDVAAAPENAVTGYRAYRESPGVAGDRVAGLDHGTDSFETGESQGDDITKGPSAVRGGGAGRRPLEEDRARQYSSGTVDELAHLEGMRMGVDFRPNKPAVDQERGEPVKLGQLWRYETVNGRVVADAASNTLRLESGDSLATAEAALGAVLMKNGVQLSRADTTVMLALADTVTGDNEKNAPEVARDAYARGRGRTTVVYAGWLPPAKAASLSYDLAANPAFRVRDGRGVFVTAAKLQRKLQLAEVDEAEARRLSRAEQMARLETINGLQAATVDEIEKELDRLLADGTANDVRTEPAAGEEAPASTTTGGPVRPAGPQATQVPRSEAAQREAAPAKARAPEETAPELPGPAGRYVYQNRVAADEDANASAEGKAGEGEAKAADVQTQSSGTGQRSPAVHAALRETASKAEGRPEEAEQSVVQRGGEGLAEEVAPTVVPEAREPDEASRRVAAKEGTVRPGTGQAPIHEKGKQAEEDKKVAEWMKEDAESPPSPPAEAETPAAGAEVRDMRQQPATEYWEEGGQKRPAPTDSPDRSYGAIAGRQQPAPTSTPQPQGGPGITQAQTADAGGGTVGAGSGEGYFLRAKATGDAMFVVLELTFDENAPPTDVAAERAAKEGAGADASRQMDADTRTRLEVEPQQPAAQE